MLEKTKTGGWDKKGNKQREKKRSHSTGKRHPGFGLTTESPARRIVQGVEHAAHFVARSKELGEPKKMTWRP